MSDVLRVGVIGLGWQGAGHLANFAAHPLVELAAICDLNADLLAERAEAYPTARTYRDYQALLADEAVDAVSLVLPDHLHREPALAALQAGKHVLCEKPLALTNADAEAIAAAADASDRVFMLNLSNRFMYPFASGKATLDSGAVGAVKYIHTRMANRLEVPLERLKWLQKSHLAFWIGIHRLDIARWWIGREAVRVRALERGGVLRGHGVETHDLIQATIEFDGGAVVNLEANWILPAGYPSLVDSRFYALCENGVIDVDRSRSELAVAGEGFELSTPTAGPTLGVMSGFTFAATSHFIDCCLTGAAPVAGAADGLALTRILVAIAQSAANDGEVIDLA